MHMDPGVTTESVTGDPEGWNGSGSHELSDHELL